MTQTAPSQSNEEKAKRVYAQAVDCIKKQDFNGAEKYLTESINIFPTADAAHNLGTLRYMQQKIDAAIELFHTAVKIDPYYDAAYANLMRIKHQQGDIPKAIEYSALAMAAAPEKKTHKIEFIKILNKLKFQFFHPDIKRLITLCLEDGTLDYDRMGTAWFSLMVTDPELSSVYNLKKHSDFKSFEKAFLKMPHREYLLSPYLLLGLKNLIVGDQEFESLLTNLRKMILKDYSKDKRVVFNQTFLPLVTALSIYCFYTEYVFFLSTEEKEWLEILKSKINSSTDTESLSYPLCILSCYQNIHTLPKAEQYKNLLEKNDEFKQFVKYHLSEPLEELEIKKTIESLTELQTDTSRKVQEQYEELPYPRWRYLRESYGKEDFQEAEQYIPKHKLKILVAGTGTGCETLYYTNAFQECQILAVDLSRTSLAYAIRKGRELGIKNVAFKQADILGLDKVLEKDSFDLVSCSGVLHHMKEPEKGLSVITNLLKPGNVMHLALYSQHGRKHVENAHKIIAKKQMENNNNSMMEFRALAKKYLGKTDFEAMTRSRDYYFKSGFKDLIFHVMEHRYDIPQLNDMLKRHGLEFLGFRNDGDLHQNYSKAFPDDPQRTNLDNWNKFEIANPDTFRRMYQFWVRKKP
ncbi:MAG: methyltransferase domain-containing protein [Alphaproteobacteria bacterium]|nr:methyltransferase domain-containing protein [Alphaproteobacteria bacterium]MBP7758108.1 methyltransferase domain-containing protein [Alphaproteobacteria bacterium]MBP7761459.1 methyltransferase domain-containing protein [Alphaproteobacteria bacterium]MBP7903806.1 methyltransferase domain-containing protein [Alphaproteobacteria bacterium]